MSFQARQPWEDEVLPYVLGELSGEERASFESILKDNELCRVQVYEARQMIARLKSMPHDRLSRDLSADIQAVLQAEAVPKPIRFPVRTLLKTAALFLLLFGAALAARTLLSEARLAARGLNASEKLAALDGGRAWLASAQEPSGAWDGSKWGGTRPCTIGLTGLALLALTAVDEAGIAPVYGNHIQRAVAYLSQAQHANGFIGGTGRSSLYDHAIATCALLQVYERQPTPQLKHILDGALRVLASHHDASGGWGYERSTSRPDDSTWSLLALSRASSLGWTQHRDLSETAARSFDDVTIDPEHIDFYQTYLVSSQLAAMERPEARRMLAMIQQSIVSAQEKNGPMAGSWDLSDRFSVAGGRVYTTALATLTLDNLSREQ